MDSDRARAVIPIDTRILVYAIGEPHRLARPCNEFMSAVALSEVTATTTVGAAGARARAGGHGIRNGHQIATPGTAFGRVPGVLVHDAAERGFLKGLGLC